jgi:hypothetical protein
MDAHCMPKYHFDGDPATESTRRHLERVLAQPQRRRWPWIMTVVAGSTAFGVWRFRRKKLATTPRASLRPTRN